MRRVRPAALAMAVIAAAAAPAYAASHTKRTTPACNRVQPRQLALVSVPAGRVDCGFPDVRGGNVETVITDGRGGWFVGGSFDGVGKATVPNLLHLHRDGTLDTGWHTTLPADRTWHTGYPPVGSLTLVGRSLYAGGPFGVEAIDAATGKRRWLVRADGRDGVESVAATPNRVFVGGDFTRLSGTRHPWFATLDARTGAVVRWPISIGGTFPAPSALAVAGTRLYLGGNGITTVDGRKRPGLAAVDLQTARVLPWVPGTAPGFVPGAGVGDVETIVVVSAHVFTAGHDGFGITNARTGRNENKRYGAFGYRFADSGATAYLAGDCRNSFTEIQAQPRNNLASIDLKTGRVTAWAPDIATYTCVTALAATPSQVLVAGGFSKTLG
jgi:hypothetical protein